MRLTERSRILRFVPPWLLVLIGFAAGVVVTLVVSRAGRGGDEIDERVKLRERLRRGTGA